MSYLMILCCRDPGVFGRRYSFQLPDSFMLVRWDGQRSKNRIAAQEGPISLGTTKLRVTLMRAVPRASNTM